MGDNTHIVQKMFFYLLLTKSIISSSDAAVLELLLKRNIKFILSTKQTFFPLRMRSETQLQKRCTAQKIHETPFYSPFCRTPIQSAVFKETYNFKA